MIDISIKHYDLVLILGNGFDLNLGFNTSYSSFVESEFFEELLKEENSLAEHLSEVHEELINWIDIEKELKKYSKLYGLSNDNFLDEFRSLSKALKKYLNKINFNKINENSLSYRALERVKNFTTLIVDFNYTPTTSIILKKLDFHKSIGVDHIKIHGSIEDEIIFGVEDKANIISEHIFLKKSVNINFKPYNFSRVISNCSHFVVLGHSLGETDHMYFDDFFKEVVSSKNKFEKEIVLYYHGQESYNQLFAQLDKLTLKRITKLKQLNNVVLTNTEL